MPGSKKSTQRRQARSIEESTKKGGRKAKPARRIAATVSKPDGRKSRKRSTAARKGARKSTARR